jgi:hypothetical protein
MSWKEVSVFVSVNSITRNSYNPYLYRKPVFPFVAFFDLDLVIAVFEINCCEYCATMDMIMYLAHYWK